MPHQTRITSAAPLTACPACGRRQNRDAICCNPRCSLFDQGGRIALAREAALAEIRALLHHQHQETPDE
jgi:hypothetical protein